MEAGVNGVRLEYEEFGEGEPVLLICGTGMAPILWQLSLVPALVGAGFKVVTYSNRGVPPSDSPPAPYTTAEMAADAIDLIETLGIGPCRVVGYSLGGAIAEEVCYSRPDLVREVVLMASAGHPTAFVQVWSAAEVEVATSTDLALRERFARDLMLMLLPIAMLQDDDASVDAFNALFCAGDPWVNPGRLGQWSANLARTTDPSRSERWSALTHRCLVLAFEHDVLLPPSRGREAAAAMPNATFLQIDGAAHGGPLTHPEAVGNAVAEFFAG